MRVIDLVLAAARYSPEVPLKSKLLSPLKKLENGIDERRYLGGSLLLSTCFGVVVATMALVVK